MTTQTAIFEALFLPTAVKLVPWGGGTAIVGSSIAVAGGNRDGYYKANFTGAVGKYHLIAYDVTSAVMLDEVINMVDTTDEQYVASLVGLDSDTMTELTALLAGFDGYTLIQVLRIVAAAMAGKSSGANLEGGTIKFRDLADTIDRITAVCDGYGNRESVTILPD